MIDWTIFNTYLGNFDKAQILMVIDDFLTTYAEMLLKLKTAVSEKDYSAVDQVAHPLKSNCKWFGATVAADLAYDLELMGKRNMEDNMSEVYPKLADAVAELVRELQEYKDALNA
jgi:HPt (histidine-containing phosphotransfer) domain-containing protein